MANEQHKSKKRRRDSYSARCLTQTKRDLANGKYTVFDIETTGGNPQKSALTEICMLRYHKGKIEERFYSLVNPQIPIPSVVKRLTGLKEDELKKAPKIEQVMPKILNFIADSILVSHNTMADVRFLKHFALTICRRQVKNFFLCTHLLVGKLLTNIPDKSLRGISAHLGLEVTKAHRAENDARMTVSLFEHVLQELQRHGVMTVADAIRLQGDIESTSKIGWAIDNRHLQELPSCPGVVRLFDRERKLIFKTSYLNLNRDVRELGQCRNLPRTISRNVLQSYSLKTKPFPNLFSAMLWEQLPEGEQLNKGDLGYQRNLTTLFFQSQDDMMRIAIGEIPVDAEQAFGPVTSDNRRLLNKILADVATIFGKKASRQGMFLPRENALLVEFFLRDELAKRRAELEKKRGGRLSEFVRAIFLNRNTQNDIDQLQKIKLPNKKILSLLEFCGLLVVSSYTKNSWQIYPIVHAQPIACFTTNKDWQLFLRSSNRQQVLHRHLSQLHKQKHPPVGQQNRGRINATLWSIFGGNNTFIPLKDLKKKI